MIYDFIDWLVYTDPKMVAVAVYGVAIFFAGLAFAIWAGRETYRECYATAAHKRRQRHRMVRSAIIVRGKARVIR